MVLLNKTAAIISSIVVFTVACALVFSKFANLPGYNLFSAPIATEWLLFSALALLVGIALPAENKFSSMVIWVVFYMHIFPWIMLGSYYIGIHTNIPAVAKLLDVVSVSIIFVLISVISSYITVKTAGLRISSKKLLNIHTVIIVVFAVVLLITLNNIMNIPKYSEIYHQRTIFKYAITTTTGGNIISRLLLIITYTIIPFSLVFSSYLIQIDMHKRTAIITSIVSFLASVLIYSIAAFKSTVAVAALSFLTPVLLHRIRRLATSSTTKLFWLLALAGVVSLTAHLVSQDSRWLLHYFRRIFIVPGMHDWIYIDIFPAYPPQLVREAPLVVARLVYGTEGSANSGLVGSGYALGGAIGVIINFCIFCIWLTVANSYSRNLPAAILVPLAVIYGYLFANSATTTVLFSYGAILVPIIFSILSSSVRRL